MSGRSKWLPSPHARSSSWQPRLLARYRRRNWLRSSRGRPWRPAAIQRVQLTWKQRALALAERKQRETIASYALLLRYRTFDSSARDFRLATADSRIVPDFPVQHGGP